jgi:hypothetical protein
LAALWPDTDDRGARYAHRVRRVSRGRSRARELEHVRLAVDASRSAGSAARRVIDSPVASSRRASSSARPSVAPPPAQPVRAHARVALGTCVQSSNDGATSLDRVLRRARGCAIALVRTASTVVAVANERPPTDPRADATFGESSFRRGSRSTTMPAHDRPFRGQRRACNVRPWRPACDRS